MVRKCYTDCRRTILVNLKSSEELFLEISGRHLLILHNMLIFYIFSASIGRKSRALKKFPQRKKIGIGEGSMTLYATYAAHSVKVMMKQSGLQIFYHHTSNKTALCLVP